METVRNLANVGRKIGVSGQNLQHFVSNSTWSCREVILANENEVRVQPAHQEAITLKTDLFTFILANGDHPNSTGGLHPQ
jgi:hypothetical protein